MTTAVELRFLRRRRQRLHALPPDELGGSGDLARPEVQLFDVVGHRHHVEDVAVDLQLAADVSAAEAELVGSGDDPTQRIRGTHHDRGAGVGGPEARAVVGAEGNRDVVTEYVGEKRRNAHEERSYR